MIEHKNIMIIAWTQSQVCCTSSRTVYYDVNGVSKRTDITEPSAICSIVSDYATAIKSASLDVANAI